MLNLYKYFKVELVVQLVQILLLNSGDCWNPQLYKNRGKTMVYVAKKMKNIFAAVSMFTLLMICGQKAQAQETSFGENQNQVVETVEDTTESYNLSNRLPPLKYPLPPLKKDGTNSTFPPAPVRPIPPIQRPKIETPPKPNSGNNAQITQSWQFRNNTTRALTTKDRVRVSNIKYIVLHHTAMSNDQAAIRELESSLFAHYSVLKSGQIYQHLEDKIVAEGSWDRVLLFQADQMGNVSNKIIASPTTVPVDRLGTIHIEINYAPQKGEVPTAKQLEALSDLIADLAIKYDIPPTHIIGHSSIQTCGSNWFKDHEGDWFRINEPSGIMYTYSNSGGCRPTFNPGMYSLTSSIRSKGVWKDGIYQNMTDRQVANVIYRSNYGNAEQLLNRVGGKSVAKLYRQLIDNLKE